MAGFLLVLEKCVDPALAGGKAAGLSRLIAAGFKVPSGICVTTAAYQEACRQAGIDLGSTWKLVRELPFDQRAEIFAAARLRLAAVSFPPDWSHDLHAALESLSREPASLWAVRSSATNEDAVDASSAGLYKTDLGASIHDVPEAIRRCWASLWEEQVFSYLNRNRAMDRAPAMAVVIQPMIAARVSGVAFSRHPVSTRDDVLINAVPGLGESLVSGRSVPDEYVVSRPETGCAGKVLERRFARRTSMAILGANGLVAAQLTEAESVRPSLMDQEIMVLASVVSEVERVLGQPVDVEWVFDQDNLWILQARPASSQGDAADAPNRRYQWSRANFKETLPEVPSPLSLSFLKQFMEDFILRHYRELGCVIPAGLAAVQTVHGRPFINVTLLQSCLAQLGGHPELVTEQMGGESRVVQELPMRLPILKLVRALFGMHRKIRRALRGATEWFDDLKEAACAQIAGPIEHLPAHEALRRMEWLGNYLHEGECTFAIVAAVGQAQQVFGRLLPQWLGAEWRSMLNHALQGQHTIISARQIRLLGEIGEHARHEARARAFFLSDPWKPDLYQAQLQGTACLAELEGFLAEFGHRAIGESDIMSPRFSENPTYLLEIIRRHILDAPRETAQQVGRRQERDRAAALALIRRRLGWRYDRRWIFDWWYKRLCRASVLREANRHHLMYYATAMRRLSLVLGKRLTEAGCLSAPDDVFFVTTEEFTELARGASPVRDWKALVAERRALHQRYEEKTVPDFIPASGDRPSDAGESEEPGGRCLRGISISGGIVEGPVVVVRGRRDIAKVRRGDIVVVAVIDPGMAAMLGLAAGLIAEMGGTLSHGAIIVREYGIPAVVNIPRATELLEDGDCVSIDAVTGLVRRNQA